MAGGAVVRAAGPRRGAGRAAGPGLGYATYLGGGGYDYAHALAVDGSGNVWVAGRAWSTNFPVTADAWQKSHGGGHEDAFVAKFSPSGQLLYATYLGGGGNDYAHALAVDGSGNVWVAGQTESTNFPVTADAWQKERGGLGDAFVAKFSPSGALLYATYLGGGREDYADALAVDGSGDVWVAGVTRSTNFPVTADAWQKNIESIHYADAFVARFSPSGELRYATYLGGGEAEYAHALAVDGSGNVWVAGVTYSDNFSVTADARQKSHGGGYRDAFVAKFAPSGQLLYATYLGGGDWDRANALVVDGSGDVWVAGRTFSTNFPVTADAWQKSYGGGVGDAFVAKFAPSGALRYATYLGGNEPDYAHALAVDGSGDVWVAGRTFSTNFPVTADAWQKSRDGGHEDAFVARFGAPGAAPAPGPRPIVFLPGIMGSELYADAMLKERVWGPLPLWSTWENRSKMTDYPLYVKLPGREIGPQDYAKALMDRLYKEFPDRHIYFFSYDWRLSSEENAKRLKAFVDSLPSPKVDLVAHSMGGSSPPGSSGRSRSGSAA